MSSDDLTAADLFSCQRCGNCCKGYGGTYLTGAEIDNICRYLGLGREQFLRHYCQLSGNKPLVAQGENGYCIFWDQLCTIHPVKPQLCQKWPFIESILVDVRNWQIMAASCPGMRTGFSDGQIQKCIRDVLNKSC
jgi:Fe-S-cluster containining protein